MTMMDLSIFLSSLLRTFAKEKGDTRFHLFDDEKWGELMRMIIENSGQFWIKKDKLAYLHGFFFWCRSKLQPEIAYESIMEWGLKSVLFLGKTGNQCSLKVPKWGIIVCFSCYWMC
jgi:hypothetical protein